MASLELLRDLQATHDYLRTIERDLAAFPPDLATLDGRLKTLAKRQADLEKAVTDGQAQLEKLAKDLALAQRLEGHAREGLKTATQKVQYTAAVRELDHRERERAAIARPLKDLEAKLAAHREELAAIETESASLRAQFEELHGVFLVEHETQVSSKTTLSTKLSSLEGQLSAPDLNRFRRLLQQRQGRAVVAVENGICTGCRTKMRIPVMSALREATQPQTCESCQRILFLA